MKLQFPVILAISVIFGLGTHTTHAQVADTVLTGGKILTVDSNFSIVESLAITDGRITAVGCNEDTLTVHRCNRSGRQNSHSRVNR